MIKLFNVISALSLATPFVASAQGYQVNLQGQVQQGMGGAGTAYVHDAATLFFNPGGASFLRGNSANVGASPTISKGIFLDKNTNQSYRTNSPVSFPFAVYGTFEVKDSSKLKLGLAIYTPFGSTVEWEEGWAGRFVLTRLQLRTVFLQPTVSYKINDKIGIGLGLIAASGQVDLQRDIPAVDAAGNFGHAELKGSAQGFGFNAGIYYQPVKKLSIGLTYRSQVNMKIDAGDATFKVPSVLGSSFPNGRFTSELPLPQVATIGFAFKPDDRLILALDVNYVGWKAYDTLAFDYEKNTSVLPDTKSARNYENSVAFRLGAQYNLAAKISARVGCAYALSPVQDGYVTPETPDANRINFTLGLGYLVTKNFGLNASFLFTTFKRSGNNIETNLNGTYKTNVSVPGISVFYNF
jgi:long-chain fatty acid transport protein